MTKTPPTERQMAVLQWIADGCPNGVMTDTTYKVSAYALEDRNLVRTQRRRKPWTAEITGAGKRLLAHPVAEIEQPDGSVGSPESAAAPTNQATEVGLPPASKATKKPLPAARPKSATEQMMDRLAVESVIEFEREDTGRYKSMATFAKRKNLVPEEMELVVTSGWSGPCQIELRRRPEWQLVRLDPIAVPETLRNPHDVVSQMKQLHTNHLDMDTPRWNWTLRVIQSVAMEAESRGYQLQIVPIPKPDRYGYVDRDKREHGQIRISIGEDAAELGFKQTRKSVPRILTAADLRRKANGYQVATEELVKTDFIQIRVIGLEPAFWPSEWTETDADRADGFLNRILQEIELRAANTVQKRLQKQQREDEERNKWERVHAQALERFGEDHRAKILLEQAKKFQRAELLGSYITAIRTQLASMDTEAAIAATEWLEWAERYAAETNPLQGELRMPDVPTPDAAAIKPYMKGLSPYGPGRSYY